MATEQAAMSMNGTYAAHQGQAYDQNYAAHNANAAAYSAAQHSTSTPQSTSSNSAADIPKDEVGWYFVEQYYTTLSRTPEKLFVCLPPFAGRVALTAVALLQQALAIRFGCRRGEGRC